MSGSQTPNDPGFTVDPITGRLVPTRAAIGATGAYNDPSVGASPSLLSMMGSPSPQAASQLESSQEYQMQKAQAVMDRLEKQRGITTPPPGNPAPPMAQVPQPPQALLGEPPPAPAAAASPATPPSGDDLATAMARLRAGAPQTTPQAPPAASGADPTQGQPPAPPPAPSASIAAPVAPSPAPGAPSPAPPTSSGGGAPIGIQLNNPLNVRGFPGQPFVDPTHPDNGKFANYPDMSSGVAGAAHQISLYDGRGLNTVSKIIATWAPSSDGNNPGEYADFVSKALGVSPDAKLDLKDPAVVAPLVNAMARMETGRPIPPDALQSGVAAGLGRTPGYVVAQPQGNDPNAGVGSSGLGSPSSDLKYDPNTIPRATMSDKLMALASGLLSGPTFGAGLGRGMEQLTALNQQDRQAAFEGQKLNLSTAKTNADVNMEKGRLAALNQPRNVGQPTRDENGVMWQQTQVPATGAYGRYQLDGKTSQMIGAETKAATGAATVAKTSAETDALNAPQPNGQPIQTSDGQYLQPMAVKSTGAQSFTVLPGAPSSFVRTGLTAARLNETVKMDGAKLDGSIAYGQAGGKADSNAETAMLNNGPVAVAALSQSARIRAAVNANADIMGPGALDDFKRYLVTQGLSVGSSSQNTQSVLVSLLAQQKTQMVGLMKGAVGARVTNMEAQLGAAQGVTPQTTAEAANLILDLQDKISRRTAQPFQAYESDHDIEVTIKAAGGFRKWQAAQQNALETADGASSDPANPPKSDLQFNSGHVTMGAGGVVNYTPAGSNKAIPINRIK